MSILLSILTPLAMADPSVLEDADGADSQYFEDLIDFWETGDGPMGIVNGEETSDYPATVSLASDAYSLQSFCSGTLIHKRWVLTAAHCLENVESTVGPLSSLKIIFGPSITNSDDEIGWDEYHYHPNYNGSQFDWDIGLVKLSKAKEDVDPMVLNDEELDDSWIDTELRFVGYGVTSDAAQDAGVKRTTMLPVDDFDSQFVYTGAPNTNTCYGDSGGPGYEITDEGLEVAGIVSYGEGGCMNGQRTANTNVAEFIDWISEYVTPELEHPAPELGGGGDGGLGLGVGRDLSDSPFGSDRAGSGAQLGCTTTSGPSSVWLALLTLLAMRRATRRDSCRR